jgi:hypothetical protein
MKIRRQEKAIDTDELAEAIRTAREAKLAYQHSEEQHKKAQHMLAELMIARQVKSGSADIDGQEIIATVVQTERNVINEEGLRSSLGSDFEKIAVLKVDNGMLAKAITEGSIDMNAIAENVKVVPSAPYVRFSVRGVSS